MPSISFLLNSHVKFLSVSKVIIDDFRHQVRCRLANHFMPANHATYEDKDVTLRDMTLSQWNNTITTNLTSTFLVIRAFLRQLDGQPEDAKRNVAVVLIGSTAGKYGEAGAVLTGSRCRRKV